MKHSFKVGDRVAVYGPIYGSVRVGVLNKVCVEVKEIKARGGEDSNNIRIQMDDGDDGWVHEKQCRRLKPKRKAREWTMYEYDHGLSSLRYDTCSGFPGKPILVREVLKKDGAK